MYMDRVKPNLNGPRPSPRGNERPKSYSRLNDCGASLGQARICSYRRKGIEGKERAQFWSQSQSGSSRTHVHRSRSGLGLCLKAYIGLKCGFGLV